jgi:CheY-like chemotaxis protein
MHGQSWQREDQAESAVLDEPRIRVSSIPSFLTKAPPMTTILIAEDDPTIVAVLTEALESEGYDVVAAIGPAAIEAAIDAQPALALVDLNMPGMDGIELCRRLRHDPRTRDVRLVLMSAAYRLRARQPEITADLMLPKPFDLNRLLAIIDDLIG